MKSKLFDMVLHESKYDGMEQVLDEKELKTLLDMGVEVEAKHTGPFGENTGAKVIGFGTIKDYRDTLEGVEYLAEEDGYDDIEEWLDHNENVTIAVISQPVGQSDTNFYIDANNIEDLDFWASASEIATYFRDKDESGKSEKTCPKCGGEEFKYIKLDKLVMGRDTFDACMKCGTMIPVHMKK